MELISSNGLADVHLQGDYTHKQFEIQDNPFCSDKQAKNLQHDSDQEQSTDTDSKRDSVLDQERTGDFVDEVIVNATFKLSDSCQRSQEKSPMQLDQSSDDSQIAVKQEQSKVDQQQTMVALEAHARNLDEVLEHTSDYLKNSSDVSSTLMENFSWLELGLFFINVLLYLSSLDQVQAGLLPEISNTMMSQIEILGNRDMIYLQEDVQSAMVQNVLNYLYTVIVYMLSVSLILTSGSRIRRFLDAFDDLEELGLSKGDSSAYGHAIDIDGKDAPLRNSMIKPKRKAQLGLGGKQTRKSGVGSVSINEETTPLMTELQVFLERVLLFVARQKMHDGEVIELQVPAAAGVPRRSQSLLVLLDAVKFWGILVLRASFYFLNLCMLFVSIVYGQ